MTSNTLLNPYFILTIRNFNALWEHWWGLVQQQKRYHGMKIENLRSSYGLQQKIFEATLLRPVQSLRLTFCQLA